MQEEDETIAVTRNGEAVGVLMNLSRYEALMETIEILADREVVKSLKQSKTDFETGRVIDEQDVWED